VTIFPSLRHESTLRGEHPDATVVGVDEVGRGALVAAVVAGAAAIAPTSVLWEHLDDPVGWLRSTHDRALVLRDSKTMSRAQLAYAANWLASPLAATLGIRWAVGAASPRCIERSNIRLATITAMQCALRRLPQLSPRQPVHVLVDGGAVPELGYAYAARPKADRDALTVSIGSIVAKVHRDQLMGRLAQRYIHAFGCWENDVGYPSPAHRAALAAHGPTPHHRRTFRGVGPATDR
jgi:ribonuclease HII